MCSSQSITFPITPHCFHMRLTLVPELTWCSHVPTGHRLTPNSWGGLLRQSDCQSNQGLGQLRAPSSLSTFPACNIPNMLNYFVFNCIEQFVSIRANFAPRGHLTISGDIFSYQNWGEGCYWFLMGRGQRCC